MRRGTFLLFTLLFLAAFPARAQYVAGIAREKPIIKLSALPMFHIDNAFVIGAEIPLAKGRFSLQPEIGYGPPESNIWYEWWFHDTYPDKTTLRTKLQFRSYFREGGVFRAYYGGEYSYKQSDYKQEYTTGGSDVAIVRQLDLRRTTHAMHGIMGWQGYFSSRLSIDFQIGFGLRASENRSLTKGLSTEELDRIKLDERGWFGRSKKMGQYGPYPSFMGAVQLGFILGKLD